MRSNTPIHIHTHTHIYIYMHEGKVKSSRPSLRETRNKRPLGRDPDRNWCHRHTSVKLSWSQPMYPWTERQHTRMMAPMSIELWAGFTCVICASPHSYLHNGKQFSINISEGLETIILDSVIALLEEDSVNYVWGHLSERLGFVPKHDSPLLGLIYKHTF